MSCCRGRILSDYASLPRERFADIVPSLLDEVGALEDGR